jgi:hypothetical protein
MAARLRGGIEVLQPDLAVRDNAVLIVGQVDAPKLRVRPWLSGVHVLRSRIWRALEPFKLILGRSELLAIQARELPGT